MYVPSYGTAFGACCVPNQRHELSIFVNGNGNPTLFQVSLHSPSKRSLPGECRHASSTPDDPLKFATPSFGCRFPSLGSDAALSLTANGAPSGRLDKRGLGRQLRRLREQLVPLPVRDRDDPLGFL